MDELQKWSMRSGDVYTGQGFGAMCDALADAGYGGAHRFVCTEQKGHEGPHLASNGKTLCCDPWARKGEQVSVALREEYQCPVDNAHRWCSRERGHRGPHVPVIDGYRTNQQLMHDSWSNTEEVGALPSRIPKKPKVECASTTTEVTIQPVKETKQMRKRFYLIYAVEQVPQPGPIPGTIEEETKVVLEPQHVLAESEEKARAVAARLIPATQSMDRVEIQAQQLLR